MAKSGQLAYLVLDRGIAPHWGHILGHDGGGVGLGRMGRCTGSEVGDRRVRVKSRDLGRAVVIGWQERTDFFDRIYTELPSAHYAMEDEERPKKLPKLGHDDQTTEEQLGPAMTGAVVPASEADDAKDNTTEPPPMSKNQLKKLRRRERWDSQREGRKEKRKQQQVNKRERRRQMIEEAREKGDEAAVAELLKSWECTKSKHRRSELLPLTFVMDCGYDELMKDKERISLASQLTRSYSDNAGAPFRAHLAFSSYNKLLKERFETVLPGHKNWKEIHLLPEDFVHAAEAAKERMLPPRGDNSLGRLPINKMQSPRMERLSISAATARIP